MESRIQKPPLRMGDAKPDADPGNGGEERPKGHYMSPRRMKKWLVRISQLEIRHNRSSY
jgi:hypothetical protein